MNVFILNTGRCGSATFIKACHHITNYTASHESRTGMIKEEHFSYPDNHIEADCFLSWFLGRLNKAYGDKAIYVHLKRDKEKTTRSLVRRYQSGIMAAYRRQMLRGLPPNTDPLAVAQDYCNTVTSNIELFLKDKSKWMNFSLENAQEDFPRFWDLIGAEGDLAAALAEFNIKYNASKPWSSKIFTNKYIMKILRIIKHFPSFLKNA
jgi:hypothetical protein